MEMIIWMSPLESDSFINEIFLIIEYLFKFYNTLFQYCLSKTTMIFISLKYIIFRQFVSNIYIFLKNICIKKIIKIPTVVLITNAVR